MFSRQQKPVRTRSSKVSFSMKQQDVKVIFQTQFLKPYLPLKKGRVGKLQDRQDILENKQQINGRQTPTVHNINKQSQATKQTQKVLILLYFVEKTKKS